MASALRDPAPPATAPAATRRSVLSGRLDRLGRRERVVMALAVLALAVVPALVSALRPATLWSETRLAPEPGERARPGLMAPLIERWVSLPVVQDRIAFTRSRWYWLVDLDLADVEASPAGPGGQGAFVRVPGRTPGEAQEVAEVVARQLVKHFRGAAKRREGTRRALLVVDKALRDPDLTPARRDELLRQRRFINVQARGDEGVAALRVVSRPTRPDGGVVDGVTRRVVSDGVPRPHPLWAGLAGLLMGLALCALWLALPVRGRAP